MNYFRSFFILSIGLISLSSLASEIILIKNATVVTSSELGVLDGTDVMIQDGIITSIGKNLSSDKAILIEANGRFLTSGILAPVTNLIGTPGAGQTGPQATLMGQTAGLATDIAGVRGVVNPIGEQVTALQSAVTPLAGNVGEIKTGVTNLGTNVGTAADKSGL